MKYPQLPSAHESFLQQEKQINRGRELKNGGAASRGARQADADPSSGMLLSHAVTLVRLWLTSNSTQHSSSQSVLWCLEELGVDYDIQLFDRPADKFPEGLEEMHLQGKSPQLVLASGQILTQAPAILLYLLRTYDTSHRFHNPATDDIVREEYLVSLCVADVLPTSAGSSCSSS